MKGTPIEQQKTNERVKLRGAFQGAYGAGYYNTVGSKEGWKPLQFKSTRTDRNQISLKKLDFMDEDDIKEFGSELVREEFESLGSTENELQRKSIQVDGDVIEMKTEIGSKLLYSMGWKETAIKHQLFQKSIHVTSSNKKTFGRGFDPFANAPEFKPKQKPKKLPTGGFGTGIFEEDDEIPFYEVPEEDYQMDVDQYESRESRSVEMAKKSLKSRHGILNGFIVGMVPTELQKSYVSPIPPLDYKPTPAFLKYKSKETTPITSYLTQKAQQRLDSFINKELESKKTEIVVQKGPIPVYTVPARIASSALQGFIPFENDDEKQKRYKQFLTRIIEKDKAEQDNDYEFREEKLSDKEALETREFAKAAMVFQPMSDMIANRFINEGSRVVEKEKVIRVYGKNTRTFGKWNPSKVLCRRFAVGWKQHHEESDEEEKTKLILNKEKMDELERERDRLLEGGGIPGFNASITDDTLEPEIVTEHELVEPVERVEEKPSLDLFKAIFADSDDEEPVPVTVDMSWGPTKKAIVVAPPVVLDELDIPFRPVFTKSKREAKSSFNKPRQKKVRKLMVSAAVDDEVEEPIEPVEVEQVKKVRPSAADFM